MEVGNSSVGGVWKGDGFCGVRVGTIFGFSGFDFWWWKWRCLIAVVVEVLEVVGVMVV